MKTKDRILLASLDAFSNEGVGQISTNHIADIMDISPGNLYYHFKSKGEIINELYNCFITDFTAFVAATDRTIQNAKEIWLIINLTFQLLAKYRFIFRDASFSSHRYKELARPFNKLLMTTRNVTDDFLKHLNKQGLICIERSQFDVISTNLHFFLTHWFIYAELNCLTKISKTQDNDENIMLTVNQGVDQLSNFLVPFMTSETQVELTQLLNQLSENQQ